MRWSASEMFRQRVANGTASRNANSTWTPGSATRSSCRSCSRLRFSRWCSVSPSSAIHQTVTDRSRGLPSRGAGNARSVTDVSAPKLTQLRLRVNGAEQELVIDTRPTLLDLLRERLDLIGAKKG